jgi:hypothetical protein
MAPHEPKAHVVPHGSRLPPPRPGIVISGDRLRARVDRFFYWPMIVLALLMLPLLAIEFFAELQRYTLPWWLNLAALFVIWLAFLIEFAVKVAIAECRLEYMRRNWLDIIIIVMPALRPLRAIQSLRVARTLRVFTLRGVGMKFARYVFTIVIGLEATDRLLLRIGLRKRTERMNPAKMTRHQLTSEVRRLRRLTDAWEAWYEAHEAHVEEHGGPCCLEPKPVVEDPADAPTLESPNDAHLPRAT